MYTGGRNLALKYNLDEVLYLERSPPSSAQVKVEFINTSTQTAYLRGVGRDKFAFTSLNTITVYLRRIKCWIWNNRLCSSRQRLKCDGTRAETRFRLSAKRTSPFKWAGASVQSTTGSRGVRISGSNAGYTVFRGSVKSTGYPFHSSVSPSLPLPCVTVCHHISTGVYGPEDRASRFLRNVGSTVPNYTASPNRFTAGLCSLDLLILNIISNI